ncbi:MAG: DUF5615 family PIN-like protein [Candidatus Poribacteria bacterium]|nr:DUF5615 family PIN-like protein [Candidatus Poribacteria bacterium]
MLPSLVADANIAFSVVRFLRSQGIDVVYTREEGWQYYEDKEILANAHAMHRFVLTHDSDFGHLAVYLKQPTTGIIHLRPGARPSSEVISDLRDLLKKEVDCTPPLIAVHRFGRLRIRRL